MPPGGTESLIPILENSGLTVKKDFGLAHAPERTMSGSVVEDITIKYPKIVGAIDKNSAEITKKFYSAINRKGVILVSNIKTAECVKIFEGIYRDVNIALANQLSMICSSIGIDSKEVFETANTQPYCHIHSSGIGVGGHCIPIYPYFIIATVRKNISILRLARKINDSMPSKTVKKIQVELRKVGRKLRESNILVLGLTYKGDIKETRFSPSIQLVEHLKHRCLNVYVYDPLLTKTEIEKIGVYHKFDNFNNLDVIVIATDHEDFKRIDWHKIKTEMRTKILVDGRQFLQKIKGFRIVRI
jgi:nucleotide sugar dehydrogenase